MLKNRVFITKMSPPQRTPYDFWYKMSQNVYYFWVIMWLPSTAIELLFSKAYFFRFTDINNNQY